MAGRDNCTGYKDQGTNCKYSVLGLVRKFCRTNLADSSDNNGRHAFY